MGELIILDLVLLLGLAVLPRHAGRSFLAIRRLASDGLRAVTAREPVSAVDAVRARVPAFVPSRGGPALRPALLPVAGAAAVVVAAAGLAAGIATMATTGPDQPTVEAAVRLASPPSVPALDRSWWYRPGTPVAPGAQEERARMACDGVSERRSAVHVRIL